MPVPYSGKFTRNSGKFCKSMPFTRPSLNSYQYSCIYKCMPGAQYYTIMRHTQSAKTWKTSPLPQIMLIKNKASFVSLEEKKPMVQNCNSTFCNSQEKKLPRSNLHRCTIGTVLSFLLQKMLAKLECIHGTTPDSSETETG